MSSKFQIVFLMGFMGSGKSHIAERLSKQLSWDWIDLDDQIEQAIDGRISTIFNSYGEAHFREVECQVLHQLQYQSNTIVSLGGGTPCFHNNLNFLKENGQLIYLNCSAEVLTQRLSNDHTERPLLASIDELPVAIKSLLEERLVTYQKADLIIEADQLEIAISTLYKILV